MKDLRQDLGSDPGSPLIVSNLGLSELAALEEGSIPGLLCECIGLGGA